MDITLQQSGKYNWSEKSPTQETTTVNKLFLKKIMNKNTYI